MGVSELLGAKVRGKVAFCGGICTSAEEEKEGFWSSKSAFCKRTHIFAGLGHTHLGRANWAMNYGVFLVQSNLILNVFGFGPKIS